MGKPNVATHLFTMFNQIITKKDKPYPNKAKRYQFTHIKRLIVQKYRHKKDDRRR